ncbi:hypothetical protein WMF04_27565 [Sorangium sp. So ce260]|uniref:hypothetical protein n=1 Tax=Sorangium sp. So ce260 TaxID=3133291 RepID=UPI003F5FE972
MRLGQTCDATAPARWFGRGLALLCCAAALAAGRPAAASAGDAPAGAPAAAAGQAAPQAASASPGAAPAGVSPGAAPASASPGAAPAGVSPDAAPDVQLVHAPVSVGKSGEALAIEARFDNAHLLRQAFVVYRMKDGTLQSAAFQRSGSAELAYVAVIPPEAVGPPGLDYTIETERVDGVRASVFASRERMHHVQVVEAHMDAVERALLTRLGGRRSTASARFENVDFGARPASEAQCQASGPEECLEMDEHYWKAEISYTYRLLRTVAEFSMRAGSIRGKSPRASKDKDYEAGLEYAAPSVRLRLSDSWHVEAELLAGITGTGFSMGTGGALIIGDPYGAKITLGYETIGLWKGSYFGTRGYSRVDFPAGDALSLAPMIEVTDMPSARKLGMRLVGEATLKLSDAISASLRGGYQARKSDSGGVGVGLQASVAF